MSKSDGVIPVPSDEELAEWLAFWQPLLSLSDWEIKTDAVPRHKLSDSRHTAELWQNSENRHAVIKLANDQEADEFTRGDLFDWEETFIHELVHALFEPSCHSPEMEDHQRVMHEQAVNATARALKRLREMYRAVTKDSGKD